MNENFSFRRNLEGRAPEFGNTDHLSVAGIRDDNRRQSGFPFPLLIVGKLEHAGVPGDDDFETRLCNGLLDELGKLGLLIGITFEDSLDSEAFEYLPNRDRFDRFTEVVTGAGVILVPGHCRRAVFHDDQGEIVLVEEGVDYSRDSGVVEGGIAQESDHRSCGVEQTESRRGSARMAHAHKELADSIGGKKPQRMATDIRYGDGVLWNRGLDGVKGGSMTASGTHLWWARWSGSFRGRGRGGEGSKPGHDLLIT